MRRFFLVLCCLLSSVGYAVVVDDASRLNRTEVALMVHICPEQAIDQLQAVLLQAKESGRKVTVSGAMHTQGGHTSSPHGIIVDLSALCERCLIAPRLLRVQAGATWKQVIEFLDAFGLSVDVMQSDYDFSVGGTISANAHGWQANKPPIITTIRGFHMLLASGEVVYCSRDEHADLFSAAIGGYGLLGVILDADLAVVENHIYTLRQKKVALDQFADLFCTRVQNNPKAQMFFGHVALDSGSFMKTVRCVLYEDSGREAQRGTLTVPMPFKGLKWWLFKKTREYTFYKNLRPYIEGLFIEGVFVSPARNRLLYRSAQEYLSQDPADVDLLQEYFVPVAQCEPFLRFLQTLAPDLSTYLMNMTIRHVCQDDESLLSYAREEMVAFVMFFRGKKAHGIDDALGVLARKMTDEALRLGGSYYLPYRPYQTRAQFELAYPRYTELCQLKGLYDPEELFSNQFYERYLCEKSD